MAKTLELLFVTEQGKSSTISIDEPQEPVDVVKVKQAMTQIIADGVFMTASGGFATIKGARVVERNVSEYDIMS